MQPEHHWLMEDSLVHAKPGSIRVSKSLVSPFIRSLARHALSLALSLSLSPRRGQTQRGSFEIPERGDFEKPAVWLVQRTGTGVLSRNTGECFGDRCFFELKREENGPSMT